MFYLCIQNLDYQFTNPDRFKEIKHKRKKKIKKDLKVVYFLLNN